jgi:hypothetical protein
MLPSNTVYLLTTISETTQRDQQDVCFCPLHPRAHAQGDLGP